MTPYTTLITAAQLQALQQANAPLMVFDCSFELMQPGAGPVQYGGGHIPGAFYADLDRDLSDKSGSSDAASGGRHPLPSREKFAVWLGSVGFAPGMQAVVYDRHGANYCGRLWWMLKWAGHEAVAVLDGGWQAWVAAGGAQEAGNNSDEILAKNQGQKYPLSASQYILATTKTIASNVGKPCQTLIDARATPRFKGEVEPLDRIAGHIPGALNRPFNLNIGPDGCFKPAAQLHAEFTTLLAGRDPATVAHHCGSGVSALPNLIAMEIAGLGRSALYAGSWSEWSSTEGLPVAQG